MRGSRASGGPRRRNCFYRSFMFLHFQRLLEDASRTDNSRDDHRERSQRTLVDKLGYPALTTEDFYEAYAEFLTEELGGHGRSWRKSLPALFRSSDDLLCQARCIMRYTEQSRQVRRICHCGRKRRRHPSPAACEPVNIEADQMQIIGLVDGFQQGVEVVYLDGSGGDLNSHKFSPEGSDSPSSPSSSDSAADPCFFPLLYRPGHYDCLYH